MKSKYLHPIFIKPITYTTYALYVYIIIYMCLYMHGYIYIYIYIYILNHKYVSQSLLVHFLNLFTT